MDNRLSPMDERAFQARFDQEPWKRTSVMDVALSRANDGDIDNTIMQERDVDKTGSGFFNTYHHRALKTVETRDQLRDVVTRPRHAPRIANNHPPAR